MQLVSTSNAVLIVSVSNDYAFHERLCGERSVPERAHRPAGESTPWLATWVDRLASVDLLTPSGICETKIAGDLVYQMCPASRLVENAEVEQRRKHRGILVPLIDGASATCTRSRSCRSACFVAANRADRDQSLSGTLRQCLCEWPLSCYAELDASCGPSSGTVALNSALVCRGPLLQVVGQCLQFIDECPVCRLKRIQ